jgi:ACS family hexuronate transporter-like MFS transporter
MSRPYRDQRVPIVALLFLATVINYVDRQVLSVNAPLIRDQLGLSNVDYSRVVFAFLLAYTIMQAGSGWVIDRLGTRRGFALSIVWWSVAGMMHAGANGALGFAVVRFLLGMGEAGNWPGAMRAVAEWFPARNRALAAGIFGSGTSVGAMIAPPLVVFITLHAGWRAAFLITGAAGFLWLIAWTRIYWPPAEHPRLAPEDRLRIEAETESSSAAPPVLWRSLLRERKIRGAVLARMCADPVWWFYVFWLPEYWTRARGYSLEQIGYLGWIPFLAADIGNVGGGLVSSHLIRRGSSLDRARKAVLYPSALGMTAALPAVSVEDPVWNLALISLATLSFGSWATNMLTVSADIAPAGSVGSVTGLAGMGAGAGGMLFTLSTGWLVDHFGYQPVFVAAGLLPLLAAFSVAWILGKIERVEIAKEFR